MFFLSFGNLSSQNLNENYMLFSNSKENSEYLEFISDSTLLRKPYIPTYYNSLSKHSDLISENVYKEYKFEKKNDTITIFGFNDFKDVKYKITENNYFENSNTKEVYFLRKVYEKTPYIVVKYKNNFYFLDSYCVNPNKNVKYKKRVNKMLKNTDPKKHEVNVYKSYDAFEKFGYEYVFGIVEIIKKKK